MEVQDTEAVFSRIWSLHDKLSDTIHSISRSKFLNQSPPQRHRFSGAGDGGRSGYVLINDDVDESIAKEAKNLDYIRTALENLEDHLHFFHTVQNQQRAERDTAIARLEQSRIVLAMRLASHHGKKYKVIEEAQAFVGDVHEDSQLISPEVLYGPQPGDLLGKSISDERKNFNVLNLLWSKVKLIKRTLKLDQMRGVIGNVALVAVSMLVLMHVEQAGKKEDYSLNLLHWHEDIFRRSLAKVSRHEDRSSPDCSTQLDVMLARG